VRALHVSCQLHVKGWARLGGLHARLGGSHALVMVVRQLLQLGGASD
jgi:hypothetical protein